MRTARGGRWKVSHVQNMLTFSFQEVVHPVLSEEAEVADLSPGSPSCFGIKPRLEVACVIQTRRVSPNAGDSDSGCALRADQVTCSIYRPGAGQAQRRARPSRRKSRHWVRSASIRPISFFACDRNVEVLRGCLSAQVRLEIARRAAHDGSGSTKKRRAGQQERWRKP